MPAHGPEEPPGGLLVPFRREQHVDDLAELVDRQVLVTPPAADLPIRLVVEPAPGSCRLTTSSVLDRGPIVLGVQRNSALHSCGRKTAPTGVLHLQRCKHPEVAHGPEL